MAKEEFRRKLYETLTHTPDRVGNRVWGDYDMFNEVLDGDEERRRVAYDRMRRYGGYEGSWDDFNGELGLAASSPGGYAAAGGRGASMVVPSHAPEVSYGTAVPGVTSATGGEEASVTAKRPKETTADLLVRRDKAQERFMKSAKGEALQRRMDDAYYNKLSEYLPGYLSSGQGKEFVSKAKASGMSKEQIIQAVMDEVNYLHAPEFDEMWEAGGYNEKIAAGVEASDPGLSEAMARQGNKVDVLALTDKIGREREALRQWRQEHPEAYHRGNGMSYYNTRTAQLDAAEAQMDEARRIIEEAGRDSRKGGGRRLAALGRGIRDVVTDLDTWTMGFADMKNGETLVRVLEKSDRGETLTDSEELLLDAVLTNAAARDLNAGRISGWYDAGQVTGEMLPFVVQIAASGGLTSALSEGMSAATRGLVKHGLRKMGQTAAGRAAINSGLRAGRAVSRFGQRLGTNRYGQWLAKGAAALGGGLKALPGTMAKGAVVAGSTGLPRTVADYYGREADSYEFGRGDDGRYDVERTGASPGENARRAFYSNAAEFGSEFAGGALGKVVGGMADIARTVPGAGDILGLGAQLTNKLRHTRAGRLYDAVVNAPVAGALRRATNIGGLSEEYLEEVYNNVLAGLSGDMDWSDVTSLDQNVETFMALVPAQVAFGMLGLGGMAAGLRSCNKARREMRDDADDALLPIMDGIDLADNEHIERIIKDVARSGSMGMEDKSAILRYANNTLRGRELTGSRGRSRAEDAMGDAAYQRGYGMTDGGQMDAALTEVAVLGDELAGTFSSEELYQMQAMSPSSVSRWLSERGRGEQIPAAMDYMEAAATVSGIRAGIEDRASTKAEEAERLVRENANLGTGTVVAVTLRDGRKAFVKSGEAMSRSRGEYDGGGVRRAELASNSLVVRDAATGETRMVPDGDIVRVDSEEALETSVAEARKVAYDGAIAEGGRLLRGDVDMGVGASFDVAFDDGSYGRVTVTADGGDGTVDVQMSDGSEVKGMAKEVLQVLARNYRLAKRRDERRASGRAYGMNGSAGAGSGNAPAGSDAGVRVGDTVEMDGRRGEVAEVRDDGAVVSWDDGRVTLESLEAAARGKVDDGGGSVSVNAADAVAAAQAEEAQGEDTTSTVKDTTPSGKKQGGVATSPIPRDSQGQPDYERADPDAAWDAIVEQTGGDEAMAQAVADSMVADKEAALKKAERAKPRGGVTIAEKIAAERDRKEAVERAKASLTHWQRIALTRQRRQVEAQAEQSRRAEEAARSRREQEERQRAELEEAERIRREALNGVPDIVDDTPQDARARGYRRVNGEKVDRQAPLAARQGKEVQVKFDDKNIPTGHVALIEANQLQPSHLNGLRNPLHFIDEAQPKERNDEASVLSARRMAANIRPEEITSSVTAYTGAPTVNVRGEVIQGNNRSAALREMWAGEPAQAQKYKQYLTDHAADFGLTPEDVEAMRRPVLVSMVDVSDDEAITLGQFVAQDTESGGTERIKPKNVVQRMGGDMRSFASRLLSSSNDEMTFSELVDRNGMDVLKWMQQRGHISPTQYRSAFDSRGNLTAEAKNDLRGIMYQSIFQNGNTHLEEMFGTLPAKAQKAILATAYRDYDSPNAERMNAELQASISAYHALSQMPDFASAKNYREARLAAQTWQRQYAIDDVTGESYLPSDRYSNFAVLLAVMYKGQTQSFIQNTLDGIFDLVQGTQEATLFEQPDNTPRTLVKAINEAINARSNELLLNGKFIYDGQRRSNVLAGGSAASQQGRQGSAGSPPAGGRAEDGEQTTDNRTGALPSDAERGGQGDLRYTSGRQPDAPKPSEGRVRLSDEVDENGRPFVISENGTTIFGEIREDSGLTPAPIKLSEGYQDENGKGYGLVHIEANHGDQIRQAGFSSVEDFVYYVAENYDEDNIRVGKRRNNGSPTFLLQITDTHDNTLFVEMSKDGSYWNVNSAGIFRKGYSNKKETVAKTEPQQPNNAVSTGSSLSENEEGGITSSEPNGKPTVPGGKHTDKSSAVQAVGEKVTKDEGEIERREAELASRVEVGDDDWQEGDGERPTYKRSIIIDGTHTATQIDEPDENGHYTGSYFEFDNKRFGDIAEIVDYIDNGNTLASKIAQAEAETDQNPTEAQKEAGNYRKGHVRIGQFDITVENPKGSMRRGTDANGNLWETTMQNTYGYIRGTEGVDGDHIDVFLTNDIDRWNGRRVYVVDQYNEDGTFDEHKVMLGFNDEAAAWDAYLSNYERGWEEKRKLVMSSANLEDFEKWIGSSRRKTKPFAEYRSVNAEQSKSISPADRIAEIDAQIADLKKQADEAHGRSDLENAVMTQAMDTVQPVGHGAFGDIYDQFRGKPQEAIVFLSQKRGGEAVGALHHKDVGDIDLVWGNEGTGHSDGFGLAKLVKYHPEVLGNLQEVLNDMHVVSKSPNRVNLESDTHKAAVRLEWDGEKKTWLLTAFEKENSVRNNTTDTATTVTGKRNDTATPQNTVSGGKYKQSRADGQQPVMREVDVMSLFDALKRDGEAKLGDHFVVRQAEAPIQEIEAPSQSGDTYGADNRLVSRARYEELKKRMRQKLGGQMNMGIDPEILAIGTEMAAYHIEAGARRFADYARRMIADLGDAIRPYLKSFYNGARDLPEVVESGLSDGMTPWDEVRVFDVANFDKESTDAMAAAETIAREQEVEGEADEAKGKLAVRRNGQRRKAISSRRQDAGQSGGLFEGDARLDGGLNRRFAMAVKDDMLAALAGGTKPYRGILDLRKRASGLGMEVDNDGRTDILLQELVEDGLVRAAREVAERHGSDSRETYDLVCKLYGMQPTISARSSNRIKMQQYSTPLPMAWNAARFAMSGKRGGKVLEPTAGNGMLVFAIPAWQVHANELDGTRLANLREQGFAQVTQQDATEPFEGGRQYDVVIANPPFGKREEVEYDGKMIPGLDPQITLNALASMKDDGKAAIIIGGNMEYGNNGGLKSMKPFFTYLYDHYNVKGVVDMDGSLYAKQGTTYPTRMILIDGRRSDEERARSAVYPPVQSKAIRKADSFEALYDIVDELTNSKNKTNGTEILRERKPLRPVADRPRGDADQGGREGQPAESNQPVERVRGGLDSRPEDVLGEQGGDDTRDGRGSAGGRGSDRELGGHPDQRVGREGRPSPVPAQQGESGRPAGASGRGGGRVRGGREGLLDAQLHPDGGTGNGSRPVLKEGSQRQLDTEKLPYRPHNSAFSLESVAPAAMVEAMDRTLSRIEREHGDIDEFVRKELGYGTVDELHQALAAEQVDSVAMAIYQMKQGQALIIGDQTGVGKGRQMAALIRWAVRQGEKPIFITQKADLFSDIYRDLVDIGSGDLVPFIFNDPSGNENRGEMVDANGKVVYKGLTKSRMQKVLATGKLPDGYDYAVLTYSQVNTGDEISRKEAAEAAKKSGKRGKKSKDDGRITPKAPFLRSISKGNYLFLDESHTAAGEGKTGSFMQSILRDVKAATFASATFAKRPDTMPLYAIRTSMSQAKVDPDKLISIIEKGGVTLQEIMSRELTNAGQMVRRERDMSDVVTDWETIDDPVTTRRARDNYDRTIAAFNAIIKFQEDYVKPMVEAMDKELAVMAESAGIKRGTNKMGVDNVPFASKTYNYTKQLMLALKADAIADKADSEIKSGRHPVIALESTMESSIDEYAAGEVVAEPTFGTNLLKGLDSVMQYTIKDENGKEQHARYSPRQLGEAGEKAYYELQDFIRESTSDVFISPIDAIIGRLHEMGYKVGELTGRDKYVELDNEGRAVVRKRTDKDKKRMQREFNNGELDVLILNKSASTGISLHASEKFKDQRQRTMIIAQPLSDINDYMQMIGRIDRTGQVHRGYYITLGLPVPAENRFLMMLSTKLKSLNANTTTSQDSESNEVEAPDLLNKYGSQVVVEYLRDNPDIYEKMGSPLKKGGDKGGTVSLSELDEYKPQEEDALKITGRVALLATQEQEEFYDDVVRRYNELIKYLNDTGSNDLKITVMPLRAKTLSKRVSSEGIDPTGTNPFARNSYVERVEMDVLRKPMKAAEIRKTIAQVNKGKRPEDYIRQVIATIEKEDEARVAAEEARYERSKVKAQEDIAKQTDKINRQQKRTAEEKQAAIADYVRETNDNVESKHNDNMVRINTNSDMLKRRLRMFEVGKPYLVPDNLEVLTFDFSTPAIFCGYKAKDSKITASTTLAVFATLDGRRRVEIKLSQLGALQSIHRQTQDNYDVAQSTTLDNWDSQIPTGTRKTGFIMTGNILQAIADTQDERGGFPGQLISYTDIDGNVHDGILMPDKWNTSMLKTSGAPIISRLKQIKDYMPVTSHDGKVEITGSSWAKLYYLTVPKTKKDGAVYYENKTLLDAVHGHNFYPYRGKLRADITAENIERVVRELSKLGVRVKEETNEDDALYRLDDELGEVNERFNEELRRYGSGEMDTNEMFHLGMPQGVMRAFLPDLPIVMRQRVAKKGAEKKHNVPTSALQDMPSMISDPIFVFQRDANTIGILTDMTDNDGKNVCVAIELGREIQNGGEYLEVNDIRSFHGREVKYIIEPIAHNNTLRYANKEKGLAWLSSASQPVQQEIDKQDLIDATNIVRNFENPSFNGDNLREGVGELSDDDLSIANDPVSKLLGKSTRTAAQRRAFAEKERQRMVDAVQDLAAKLHLDNVEVVTDASTLDGRRAKAKGFYSRSTGRITIVIPNHTSVFDAEQTLLHEAVAHYGLRELFGEHFDTFLDNVLANADEAVRRRILELSRRHGWDSRTATEEYLASLAEETNFEAANRTGWWQKIKELFLDMLHQIGFEDFSGVTLSDNELRYILWRSYENLREPGRYRSILGEAEDIARQAELKVGRYAEDGGAGAGVAAESGSDSKAERIRKLRESEPVEITGKEIEASDDLKQYKKNALEYGKSLRANYQNKDTGVTIQLGKTGVKEVLNHDYKNVEQLQSIAAIPQIIENSIYIDSQENADPEKNEDVSMYHYYVCGLKIGDSDYTVRAVIAEQPNGNRYYDHKLTQIEKGKLLDSLSGITTPGFNQETFPISEVKDTKLLSLLQTEEEEKVLYRMADSAEDYERALVRDKYEKRAGSLLFNSAESVFDNMQSLKEAMQMIVKAEGRGMHIEEIEGFENAYLGENRLSSVNEDEMRRVARELYKPLIDAVSRLAPDKAAREALMRYMKAKHGLERNVEMRVREKERVVAEKAGRRPHDPGEDASPRARAAYEKSLAEWEERVDGLSGELAAIDRRDFAGLTGLTGEVSVAGAEAAAARLVEDYERYHDVSEVWSRMRAATDFILDKSLDSGLLGRASYDRIKGMYGNYVPLRGFAETTVAERYNYLDQLQGGVGNVLKRAKGRTTEADDPLVELSLMLDSVVMQGNRNLLVKQRFLNFVMNHPSDLVSVSGLYIEHDEVTGRWRAVSPELDAGMSAAEVSSAMTAFVSRMDKLCEEQPERYKKVDDRVDVPYIVPDQRTLRQHQVIVKRGGRDVVLTVNGNPRLAQALNGLLNPDHNIGGVADRVLQAGETLNRHLAAFYTSRNPDFVLSNFIRDAFYSNAMTWVKEGGAYSRRFMSNMGQFNPASIVRLIYRYEHGQLDMGNEVERLFKLFMQHGGETGWTIMRNIDKHRKAVERELRNSRHMTVRQGWDVAMGYYDLFNRGVENCARFAAFLTSMQSGRSIDRSIWDAKEVSVNFNKRGSGIKAWDEGAGWGSASNWVRAMSGMGRAGYVFWNASVQGLSNFARAAKRNPGRVVPLAAVSFGLGLLAPVVNEMLVAAMGGDDEYYDLPEFYRRSNWVFALPGGGWLTLPLPIELRAFYGAGELASSLMGGKVRMSGGEITMELAATVSQVLPLNFLEGGGSWQALVPSAAAPVVEVVVNRDWTGIPVYRSTTFNEHVPEWRAVYKNTNELLVDASRRLSRWTGGNDVDRGRVEINPAGVQHVLEGYLGGFATFTNKLVGLASQVIDADEEVDVRNVPFVNRVYKEGNDKTRKSAVREDYFLLMEEYGRTEYRLREYRKRAARGVLEFAERLDWLNNSEEFARYVALRPHKSAIDKLRQMADMTDDEARVDSINALIDDEMAAAVDACVAIGE